MMGQRPFEYLDGPEARGRLMNLTSYTMGPRLSDMFTKDLKWAQGHLTCTTKTQDRPKAVGSEDTLLEGINNHRQYLKLSALTRTDNTQCLAEQIVSQIDDDPCNTTTTIPTHPITIATVGSSSSHPQLSTNFPRLLKDCNININSTSNGLILPICVAKFVATGLVCARCPQSQYAQYLRSSNYTEVGISAGVSWTAIVLNVNTTTEKSAANLVSNASLSHCFLLLMLVLFLLY
ncbi:hypothetical protein HYC85_010187 [Camellia sinensis]|uniref:Uncharacterized GPI-anchored protein At5g19230-like domain-containing protein n=1 Tax=Camellia sinensis TaxID=4442 RepID=A0A7J7HHD5_CAMSI|nr:hypothetical protein HYC85_010187 [Camellia sinensis]